MQELRRASEVEFIGYSKEISQLSEVHFANDTTFVLPGYFVNIASISLSIEVVRSIGRSSDIYEYLPLHTPIWRTIRG